MAETKRVSDQYTISAPSVIIDGNLTISGSTTSVETTNSTIKDNIIVLNNGEAGAGVAGGAGTAGIQIDRGSLPDVALRWNETADEWQLTTDGSTYVAIQTGSSGAAAGSDRSIQYNNGGALAGDTGLTWDGVYLEIGATSINSGSIGTTSSNSDLELFASGAGTIHLRSVVKLENEISDPSGIAGNNLLYAKTPDVGDTGLFFANTSNSDELISKSKAVFFGLIL
jgi:hypothetical protein